MKSMTIVALVLGLAACELPKPQPDTDGQGGAVTVDASSSQSSTQETSASAEASSATGAADGGSPDAGDGGREPAEECVVSAPRPEDYASCAFDTDCYDGSVCTEDVCDTKTGKCSNPWTVPTEGNPNRHCDMANGAANTKGICKGPDCCPRH